MKSSATPPAHVRRRRRRDAREADRHADWYGRILIRGEHYCAEIER
jgi:hypothetical protein